ncbi:MAG: hypothetical protein KGO96_12230 [Elusimicrobia bacterium]|nr:hypothetical protein [Elusimicrobiota bacterium]
MEKNPETPDVDAVLAAAAEEQKTPARRKKAEPVEGSLHTQDELDAIRKEAAERVQAAMKEAERERLLAEAMDEIRRREGQKTGRVDQDELVNVLIDVASYSAISANATGIAINGMQYQHGRTYQVPRHIAVSLYDIMARSHEHQATIDGKAKHEMFRRTSTLAVSAATGEVTPWRDAA